MKKVSSILLSLILAISLSVFVYANDKGIEEINGTGEIVGEYIEIGNDEVKIISIPEDEKEDPNDPSKNHRPLAAGISFGAVAVGGLALLLKKDR
jgi:hypothetical protein